MRLTARGEQECRECLHKIQDLKTFQYTEPDTGKDQVARLLLLLPGERMVLVVFAGECVHAGGCVESAPPPPPGRS